MQSRATEEEEGGATDGGADYQLDMMRCLREVNVDNNTVGWCVAAPWPWISAFKRKTASNPLRMRSSLEVVMAAVTVDSYPSTLGFGCRTLTSYAS